jgi:hypothetical protein
MPRGKIRAFRELLNRQNLEAGGRLHRNGRFHQLKRLYGDYLYAQDREKFMVDLRAWLAEGEPH